MTEGIKIRKARLKDTLTIRNIQVNSIKTLNARDYTKKQIKAVIKGKTVKRYKYSMENGEDYYIAVSKRKIVGFISIKENEIMKLYVSPRFVFKGTGKKLLQYLENLCYEKGLKKLVLKSTTTAKKFYQNNGYSIIRKARHVRNRVSMPVFWMRKYLL